MPKGDGAEQLAEMYEVLPVYLRDFRLQPKETPTKIEFQIGTSWMPATDQFAGKVRAVRLTRFQGAVIVTFNAPRRVKLSPEDWRDTGFSRAHCRNVLVDLLESADRPTALTAEKKVAYRMEAVAN